MKDKLQTPEEALEIAKKIKRDYQVLKMPLGDIQVPRLTSGYIFFDDKNALYYCAYIFIYKGGQPQYEFLLNQDLLPRTFGGWLMSRETQTSFGLDFMKEGVALIPRDEDATEGVMQLFDFLRSKVDQRCRLGMWGEYAKSESDVLSDLHTARRVSSDI